MFFWSMMFTCLAMAAGDRVITGDHVHLDASAVALQYGFRNTFARRINEKETDEGEVINREVAACENLKSFLKPESSL